jgi:hypothetical protein
MTQKVPAETTDSVQDAVVMTELLHGEEQAIVGDAAYCNMIVKAHRPLGSSWWPVLKSLTQL